MALLLLNNLKKYVLLLSLVSIVIIIKKNNYSTIKDYRVKLLFYLVTKNLIIHFSINLTEKITITNYNKH